MLRMLLFNMYFHAWPTSRLVSLKLMVSQMKQVLHHFTDHSQGLIWNIKCNSSHFYSKIRLASVGSVQRRTTRMITEAHDFPYGDNKDRRPENKN